MMLSKTLAPLELVEVIKDLSPNDLPLYIVAINPNTPLTL